MKGIIAWFRNLIFGSTDIQDRSDEAQGSEGPLMAAVREAQVSTAKDLPIASGNGAMATTIPEMRIHSKPFVKKGPRMGRKAPNTSWQVPA